MTAYADTDTTVYHCVVCGPCLRFESDDATVTVHSDVPHPDELTFDEEESPQ